LAPYAERAAAIVQAFIPGEEGAGAIARVLAGDVNPSGRLPVGVPRSIAGQPSTYVGPPLAHSSGGISNIDPTPLYPFGHGLSYTTFAYTDLGLDAETIANDGTVHIAATVTNTGDRAGDEVVQLYLSDESAQVTRPVKQLVGFARVSLAAGVSARVTFALHAERTAFTGVDIGRRIIEPGWFTLAIGGSSQDLPLRGRFRIAGPVRDVTAGGALTTPAAIS
jgi:beta-glucosidase